MYMNDSLSSSNHETVVGKKLYKLIKGSEFYVSGVEVFVLFFCNQNIFYTAFCFYFIRNGMKERHSTAKYI